MAADRKQRGHLNLMHVHAYADLAAQGLEVAFAGLARAEGGQPGLRGARHNLYVLAAVVRAVKKSTTCVAALALSRPIRP
jgi:hypothetical protein